ncbi:SseB family protein [Actinokineospora sp. UTMC 2448]|uniref:SseB family protein n=1 Tax=Actinokineospora sp. UTMC 2448 TaxID=2268449 RepID=UPI0021647796|nr:SseB family protein [Actinokineospora sp. UTMC 2448]UVS76378.1 hypothetical protein Actkin_00062 [Actinokineospora sp. UTMC 2448]
MVELHRGLGVRRADLALAVAGPIGARLGVRRGDSPAAVLAVVSWQVAAAGERVTANPVGRRVLAAAYNLRRDPELTSLGYAERLAVLARSLSDSVHAAARLLVERVSAELAGPLPVPPAAEIEALTWLEAEYAKAPEPPVAASLLTRLVAETTGSVLDEFVPKGELHFAMSADGALVTVETRDFGECLCAFTSAELLAEYQAAVGSSDVPAAAPGHRLIEVLRSDGGVGLALNPLGRGRHWSPARVAAL